MEATRHDTEVGAAGTRWAWGATLVALLAWQAWMTLRLFGGWDALVDDRPLVSGSHPQNLYLGSLGARALRDVGASNAYDPAFQIGVLKTPIFDGGRLAELFLFAAGGDSSARNYKLGVATFCVVGPLLLFFACWGVGADLPTTILASLLGLLGWWGPHGRLALEAGDAEIFLASLAVLAHLGFLVRFDNQPGVRAWLGLASTAALGWLAQPMLLPFALPLLLIYYLGAGVRHPFGWHVGLAAAEAIGLGVNVWWLVDWVNYWWLRSPLPNPSEMLPHRTLRTFWEAPLWGGPAHRLMALFLFASAVMGVAIWNGTKQRAAARLLGLGAAALLGAALLGISWEPLGQIGTAVFLTPALWFAALPAAHAWVWSLRRLAVTRWGRAALVAVVAALGISAYPVRGDLAIIAQRVVTTEPLEIGLGPDREALVDLLRKTTTPDARILWEDRKPTRRSSRWSALLPVLTDRAYLGGLDPGGVIEHSSISFLDQALDGTHISLWSDAELLDYCKRYHVGWVVAWTSATIERFRAWGEVEREIPVRDGGSGALFVLRSRPGRYVVRGSAQVLRMDSRHIVLADVVPEGGEVVLNLHYFAGLKASPPRVQVEREPCGHDPIGYVRLRLDAPAPRVTLTWDRR